MATIELTPATAPYGVAVAADDARSVARRDGGPRVLATFIGPDASLVTIDRGPYEIIAIRSDPAHSAASLRAATRALLALSARAGIPLTLWRSTPIGHWAPLTTTDLGRWLLPTSTAPSPVT